MGSTGTYVTWGGETTGDYIATPTVDGEAAETIYCVCVCTIPVVGVACVVIRATK